MAILPLRKPIGHILRHNTNPDEYAFPQRRHFRQFHHNALLLSRFHRHKRTIQTNTYTTMILLRTQPLAAGNAQNMCKKMHFLTVFGHFCNNFYVAHLIFSNPELIIRQISPHNPQ